ncbi:MAG: hypothetical protein RBS57_09220, partial [Desulforhabdus sp.]|nr:hypothetical protein [Desulforhabdus sp.]
RGAAGLVYGESPVWAPPPGQDAPYRYQYFPAQEVYYDPVRELYFYQDNGQWIKSPALPRYLRDRLGDFVTLRMNIRDPYRMHVEVKAHYPPQHAAIVEQAPARPPVSAERSGPPPWSPAGYGPVYSFRYYPAAFVYFDLDRGMYFYQSKGQWIESSGLPANVGENLGASVLLEMNTARPYIYHSEVMRTYPHPGVEVNRSYYKVISR